MDVHVLQVVAVVYQADHFQSESGRAPDLADQHVGRLPGSDQQQAFGRERRLVRVFVPQPLREAGQEHEQHGGDAASEHHPARHQVAGAAGEGRPAHGDQEQSDEGDGTRLDDADGLRKTDIAADDGVDAGEPVDDKVHGHSNTGKRAEVAGPGRPRRRAAGKPEVEDEVERDNDDGGIDCHRHQVARSRSDECLDAHRLALTDYLASSGTPLVWLVGACLRRAKCFRHSKKHTPT